MGLGDFGRVLVPPKNSKEGAGVTQWRWAIVVAVVLLLVNGAAGRGLLLNGVGAYAAASDVRTILELQLATELRALREERCARPKNQRATLDRVIEEYQRRYEEITGHRYPLEPCSSNQ